MARLIGTDSRKQCCTNAATEGLEFWPINDLSYKEAGRQEPFINKSRSIIELEKRIIQLEKENKDLSDKLKFHYVDSLIANFPNPVYYKDSSLKIVGCNGRFESLLDEKKEKLAGKSLWEISSGYKPLEYEKKEVQIIKGKLKNHIYECQINLPDRKNNRAIFHKTPLVDDSGTIFGIMVILVDVNGNALTKQFKENEVSYKELFNNINNGIIICTPAKKGSDFIIKDLNRGAEKIDGLTKGELTGKSILKVLPGIEDTGLFSVFRRVYETGKAEHHPPTLYKDGRIAGWRESYVYKLPSNDIVTVYEDVSSIKKLEKALRASEEFIYNALEASQDALWEYYPQSADVYFSPRWFSMLEYEPDSFPQTFDTWKQLIHPEERDVTLLKFNDFLTGKAAKFECTYRMKTKSGKWLWILGRGKVVEKDSNNNPLQVVGTNVDVHEIMEIERKLTDSNQRFNAVLNSIETLVLVTDLLTFEILFINKHTEEVFGDLVGKYCFTVLQNGYHRPCDFCKNVKLLDENGEIGETVTWESRNSLNNRYYHITDKAIRWIDGRLVKLQIAQDITEIKEAELKLSELNATKDKFLSIISHDLRSPLASLIGLSRLLIDKAHIYTAEDTRRAAIMMNKTAQKIHVTLENLLQWAKSQNGSIEFNPEYSNLIPIINHNIAIFESAARQKSIKMIYDLPDGITVYGDSNMIDTILRNILSNALKFTPRGGSITINAGVENKFAVVSIKDTGIGMTKETLDKIFKIEEKFSMPGTESEAGSGLGLILCKEFIEINKGTIEVETGKNRGSTFKIVIPCTKNTEPDSESPEEKD